MLGALKLEHLLRVRQAIRARKMQVHQVVHGAEGLVLIHKFAAQVFGVRELVIFRQGFKVSQGQIGLQRLDALGQRKFLDRAGRVLLHQGQLAVEPVPVVRVSALSIRWAANSLTSF